MSSMIGGVKFNDGTIKFYKYNNTIEMIISCLYDTPKEVYDNWSKNNFDICLCGREEPVSIYCTFGQGFYFAGKACRYCNIVRPDEADFDNIEVIETENWANNIVFW